MRLTLVHPAIGRRAGVDYMRTWQMEPLPIALLAALTPKDVEITLLRRPHGADPVSTSRPISSPSRSRPIPPSAPTRSPANIAAAASRW